MSADADRGNELWTRWSTFLERIRLQHALADARSAGRQEEAARLEGRLAELPEITPLEALQANADLMGMLTAQRWIAMRIAQAEGASLEQIGRQLGISKQSAWEFMKRRIDAHENG
ncbi:unnamed protein product [[Actinomadura] parvosata subsp. kistnae]|uniref:Uncharacterized protein n=1 Tax=[Actinomadura] parvosata subsp. kistnae TaxID=1909395 RepID=A0A1V0A1B4_9ACTN|nr:hypothetical protein [Nonomuraea sp. ATCC 55076]AQZ63977.1 hypothetical protein BKM31_23180 [Nonomuraea sp. ATCC 55076]SPL89844.1 unnamed protein product [Actinomadura parvosata subsp. kistnae]